jgi:Bacterial capsule synthesis protein PGA_cap
MSSKPFFLFLIFLLSGFQPSAIQPIENGPSVLFVATGFSSAANDINLKEISAQFKQGNVFVSNDAFEMAGHFFNFSEPKKMSVADFVPIAKGKLIVITANEIKSQLKVLSIDGISYFDNPAQYPLRDKSNPVTEPPVTKLTITGVSALSRSIGILMDEKGPETIIEHLKPHFQNSDFVHVSNEVSLTDSCVFSHRGRVFCSKEAHFKALLGLNCNIVELTGNHNKDFGNQSFIKTLQWYHQNNINTFGGGKNQEDANKPLVLTLKDGKKLGFIGFNESCPLNECAKANIPGANAWSKEKAKAIIQKMKSEMKIDVVIASVQFGEWDFYHPRPAQRKIARDLIDFGADLVFGPHAHQIQQVEFYKRKPIFFGLGNFLFDETQRIGVRQGVFVNVLIQDGRIVQVKPSFTFMGDDRVNRLANEEQASTIRSLVFVDSLLYR